MNDEPKYVIIHGQKVLEDDLKSALRDVLKKRGLDATLVTEHPMSDEEKADMDTSGDDYRYANIYRYSFIS